MYYSTGCSPRAAPRGEAVGRQVQGRFDEGWDVYREETLARQKKLGIVPEDTELSARPDLFPAWDSLTEAEKKLYARQMEVIAGYQENADWNVGRLLDSIEAARRPREHADHLHLGRQRRQHGGHAHRLVQRDDVLQRRRPRGRRADGADRQVGRHRGNGAASTRHRTTRPRGRTRATRPSSGASRWGATSAARATRWSSPGRAGSRRAEKIRARSSPTASTSARPCSSSSGIPEPTHVDGIEQEPMDGTSFAYTLDDGAAEERHTVQYFEMLRQPRHLQGRLVGVREARQAAVGLHAQDAEKFAPGAYDPDQDVWELYYLPDDFSQAHDIAAEHPEKLAELRRCSGEEAERNRVLPLLGGVLDLPRRPAAAADHHPLHVWQHGAKRPDDDDPAHPRDVRTPSREPPCAGRGRGGRHRGLRRLHRRVRAVGRREGPAQPHLPVPRRGDVQADLDRADPDR